MHVLRAKLRKTPPGRVALEPQPGTQYTSPHREEEQELLAETQARSSEQRLKRQERQDVPSPKHRS